MIFQRAFRKASLRRVWILPAGLCAAVAGLAAADTNAPPTTANAPPAATNGSNATNETYAPIPSPISHVADTNAPPADTNTPPTPTTNAPPPATNAPPALTPEQMFEGGANTYTNWIDFTLGRAFVSGNRAQFQQQHQIPAGTFGGIGDFHFQTGIATNTTLTIGGHAIAASGDYKLDLGIQREKVGYLRLSYDQTRTWSDADGGFYPGTETYYAAPGNAAALDRGKLTLEAGWTPDKGPAYTLKYTHSYRDGDEGSTEWGFAHPPGGGSPVAQGLAAALEQIHESSDSIQLDVSNHIKATDLGAGVRYETGTLNDALQVTQYPGENAQSDITGSQNTTYDLFNAHAFTATRLGAKITLTTGFSYSGADNNFTGSQIFGNALNAGYAPNSNNATGYYGMSGSSRMSEYVFDLNIFYKPAPHFTIVPSLRADKEDWNSAGAGLETDGTLTPVPYASDSARSVEDLSERLDLAYNGMTNWVFYGRADFTEGDGSLEQFGGMVPYPQIGNTNASTSTDDRRFFQKYSLGARWYPSRGVTLDAGGYYKNDHYNYDNAGAAAPLSFFTPYQDYLVMQNFQTYDANIRLTLRPWRNVTAVSRYELQLSTVRTGPDPIVGLADVESSRMAGHVIAQDVSWIPWSRLSLQAGLNYVLSETRSPGSDAVQGILAAQNNYWTVNFSSTLALDNKTDLNVSYFYYLSGDYNNNSPLGVPFGAGSEEQAVTATLTRQLSKTLRLALKYGYYHYDDAAYGGNRDFGANLITASLRYRF
jgi:hypothetical protein